MLARSEKKSPPCKEHNVPSCGMVSLSQIRPGRNDGAIRRGSAAGVKGQDAACFAGGQKLERRRETSTIQFIHCINGRAEGR